MHYRFYMLAVLVILQASYIEAEIRVRMPVAAGKWYASDPNELLSLIKGHLDKAEELDTKRRCIATVLPSGPYKYCGKVMAEAVKQFKPGQFDKVVVLAPAHFAKFRGCSIAAVQAYRTPFGDVLCDGPSIRTLCFSPLISMRSIKQKREADLHEQEFGIEIVLPFLQARLGNFRLVPVVVGELKDYSGNLDETAVDLIVEAIKGIMDDRTLLVVSTGFTHYGPDFGYMPFLEDRKLNIEKLDLQAVSLIAELDYKGFQRYLKSTGNPIDGQIPLGLLMKVVPGTSHGVMLDYNTTSGDDSEPVKSVSYGSMCFFK